MAENFTVEDIRKIRDATGVGLTAAKQALQKYKSFDAALAAMQAKALTKAASRVDRETQAGVITSYVHDRRIGVLLELNCETEFVAKTSEFQSLAKELSLQIAASSPVYIKQDDLDAKELEQETKAFRQQAGERKIPSDKIETFVQGQLKKSLGQKCLLNQSYNKEPELSVGQMLQAEAAKLGENVCIARFVRFELGDGNFLLAQSSQ